MLGFILGILYANLMEWVIHKYILHGLGKNKKSFFAFHWNEHHNVCRKNQFMDESYTTCHPFEGSRLKESVGLLGLVVAHLSVGFISLGFMSALVLYSGAYITLHRYSHVNPTWGKKYMPWHWDHHMGKNQDANWNVVFPLTDWLLKTRIKY